MRHGTIRRPSTGEGHPLGAAEGHRAWWKHDPGSPDRRWSMGLLSADAPGLWTRWPTLFPVRKHPPPDQAPAASHGLLSGLPAKGARSPSEGQTSIQGPRCPCGWLIGPGEPKDSRLDPGPWSDPEGSHDAGHDGSDALKRIFFLRHRREPCRIVDNQGNRSQVHQGRNLRNDHHVEGLSKPVLQAPDSAPRW